jgi:hypothetical protein
MVYKPRRWRQVRHLSCVHDASNALVGKSEDQTSAAKCRQYRKFINKKDRVEISQEGVSCVRLVQDTVSQVAFECITVSTRCNVCCTPLVRLVVYKALNHSHAIRDL